MLSKMAGNITPSVTVELTAKVAELKGSGIDILGFNVGEPDFDTPGNIVEAGKKAMDNGHTRYTAVSGIVELRKAICEKLKNDNGLDYQPANITVGAGGKHSLVNAVMALFGQGDEVIVPTPCWVSYVEMIKLTGAVPILSECLESKGFALNIEDIKSKVTSKTKGIIINTPNNPTGAVYSREALAELAEIVIKNDMYLISDEIYEKLIYGDKEHISIASLSQEIKGKTIIINGFSKAYAMTGWRIGYAAGPLDVIKGMNSIQSHMTSSVNSISQHAGIEALNGPQDQLEKMREAFNERKELLYNGLCNIDGITCADADGAFYLMPNVSSFYGKSFNDKTIENSIDMCDYLLTEAKVALVPGDAFESPNNIRMAYSNSIKNLEEGLVRIKKALGNLV